MTTKGKRLVSLQKASDDELLASYTETNSVWRTAEKYSMCGQSVHERLVKLGIIDKKKWTSDECAYLAGCYAISSGNAPIDLGKVTASLNSIFGTNRLKSNVCRKAKELGLGTNLRRKESLKTKKKMAERCLPPGRNIHSGAAKSGLRDDIGMFVRSSWEANYVRYLNFLKSLGEISGYEYEKHTFRFDGVSRGPFIYIPDFKVLLPDGTHEWHEVKGWMDSKSRSKLKRFAKFFPNEKMVVISLDEYNAISAKHSGLPGWEFPAKRQK